MDSDNIFCIYSYFRDALWRFCTLIYGSVIFHMFERPRVNCQVTSKLKQDLKNAGHLQAHSQSHRNSHLLFTPRRRDLRIQKVRVLCEVSRTRNTCFKESLILENWITQALLLCWNTVHLQHQITSSAGLLSNFIKSVLLLVIALLLAAYNAACCLRIQRHLDSSLVV